MQHGSWCVLSPDAEYGEGVVIGDFCRVEAGVKIGNGTVLRSYVELRAGTVIGPMCEIDSYVASSGDCEIGYGCTLRYGTIVARGCVLEPNVWCSPRVMFENGNKDGKSIGGAYVGEGARIGTGVIVKAGISIGQGAVVYPGWLVADDVPEFGKYGGVLARMMDLRGGAGI